MRLFSLAVTVGVGSLVLFAPACQNDEHRAHKEFVSRAGEKLGCAVEGTSSFTRLNVKCDDAKRGAAARDYFQSRCGEIKGLRVTAVSVEAAKEDWYSSPMDTSADFSNCKFVKQRR